MNYKENICPYCSSFNVKISGTITTLIGWFGNKEEDNPNHWHGEISCQDCLKQSTKHWVHADKSSWYTNQNLIIKGVATCCERSYIHPCTCGGQKIHSRSGKSNGTQNVAGKQIPMDPMFWQCNGCQVITPDKQYPEFSTTESINKYIEEHKNDPIPPPLMLNFFVEEKIGLSIVNLRGLK